MLAVVLALVALVQSTRANPALQYSGREAERHRLTSRQTPVNVNGTSNPDLVSNGDFADGLSGWIASPNATIQNGYLCVSVPAGADAGASYVRSANNFTEVKNDVYYLNFTAYASAATNLWLQTPDPPLNANLNTSECPLTTTATPFSFVYSPANQANSAWLQFNLGGNPKGLDVCIGNISLRRIDRLPYVQDTGPLLKVNQLGYLSSGPKGATLVSSSNSSVEWQLLDSTGYAVAIGSTTPHGVDAASDQNVHIIDFTSFTAEGEGYTLTVGGGVVSFPFAISSTLYGGLRQDSMEFFYHQRSGIEIDAALVGTQYARAAGHVQVFPNQGDYVVPCQWTNESLITYLEPWTCNYTLNASQGWYDAGDQGKYVVNTAASAAQLLMRYERTLYTENSGSIFYGDGSLRIPERSNGIPDDLDEARWGVEFVLKMQVPANSPPQLVNGSMVQVSGMVHHKLHDNQWTPLPTDPSQDPMRRELHRPSTAATLDTAAVAAMSSRLFVQYDAEFSQQCLSIARVAYAAAKANPAIYAPETDGDLGGGAYNDNDVTDEFYWAAVELFITTGEAEFEQDIKSSPYFTANASTIFPAGGFSWSSTAGIANLDLALIPSNFSARQQIIDSVIEGANGYLAVQNNKTNGYGTFINTYPWGSNSNELNCVQVVGTAYDLTGNTTYRDAALTGIDYVLGRNAIAQSYVRGYGTKATYNTHSRLYANELSLLIPQDPMVPHPPPGYMAGGANQDPADPPADDVLAGCIPQFCYVDDCNSYSTNEEAINWNAPQAWASAWAATV